MLMLRCCWRRAYTADALFMIHRLVTCCYAAIFAAAMPAATCCYDAGFEALSSPTMFDYAPWRRCCQGAHRRHAHDYHIHVASHHGHRLSAFAYAAADIPY